MSIFTRLRNVWNGLRYATDPYHIAKQLRLQTGGNPALTSISVNENSALNLAAVFSAIRVLSEDIAALPSPCYQRSGRSRTRDRSHRVDYLLNVSPDDEISAMQFREWQMKQLLTHGNAVAEIEWMQNGQLRYLHRVEWNRVDIGREPDGELSYKIDNVKVPRSNLLHVAGMGDGLIGMSPIKYASQAIGIGLMMDRFSAAWFKNGSRGGGVLTMPGKVTPEFKTNILNEWQQVHGGDNAGGLMLVDNGGIYTPISIPPEDAAYLATKTFTVQEIARIYRIPPSFLQENSRSTFSNSENEALNYVKFSLKNWAERLEQAYNRQLMLGPERYIEFNFDGLLRGDLASRYAAYNIGRQGGWLSVNDIREKENMEPIDGGDEYLTPLNMTPVGTIGEEE